MELQEKLEQDVFNWLSSYESTYNEIDSLLRESNDPATTLREYVESLVFDYAEFYNVGLTTDWLLTIISWLDWYKLADRFMPDSSLRKSRIDCIVINYSCTGRGQTIEVWRNHQHRTYQYNVHNSCRADKFITAQNTTGDDTLPYYVFLRNEYTLDYTGVAVFWR